MGRLVYFTAQTGAVLLAMTALYGVATQFHRLSYWPVFVVLIAFTIPVFVSFSEGILFKRRAMLEKAALSDSKLRRWFWSGYFPMAVQVCRAFFWTVLLLCLATLLTTAQWIVMAADGLLLVLLALLFSKQFSRQIKADYLGIFVRTWPLFWLNTVVIAVAFFLLDYFYGTADTRSLPWETLQEETRTNAIHHTSTHWVGWLTGWLEVFDQTVWHVAQMLIPNIESKLIKVMLWLLILLPAGVMAYSLNHYLLGILAMVEGLRKQTLRSFASSVPVKALIVMSGILAVVYWQAPEISFKPAIDQAQAILNPCEVDVAKVASLRQSVSNQLQKSSANARSIAHQQIDQQVDLAFRGVEARVDDYLDWYFSVRGGYSRLATMAAGKVGGQTLESLLQEKLQETMFNPEPVDALVQKIPGQVFGHSSLVVQHAASKLQGQLIQDARLMPCALGAIQVPALTKLDFSRDAKRAAISLSAGGMAMAAGQRASRLAGALSSRISSGSIIRKLLGKRGGSALGSAGTAAALCAPGGPLALACGVVVGGVTWLTVDTAMVAYDEFRYREEMKAEVQALLDRQKNVLKIQIKHIHDAALIQMTDQIHHNIDQTFIPARDGI